ncbi:helix-turn-helix domain-containing protein [Phaeobacter piscinae]|uniref:helix-turn-helix domain-containing protein n=1 Tax=Phaeobacter piscinae TaxID=1580596 RepID=UPI0009E3BB14|nr:AraC family transcriptional regulator [Phaeobacter piscinae]UTS80377.1 HTH-type transcriptional activator RhaR [Phaeobacter piscinae]
MIFIPIEFMFSAQMMFLFIHVVRNDDTANKNKPFLLLILLSAVQSFLLGLRWGYDVEATSYIVPILATLLPALVYAGVLNVIERDRWPLAQRMVVYYLPTVLVVGLTLFWREAVDIVVVITFLAYAVVILRLLLPGTDALGITPLDGADSTYRAIFFAALSLLSFALIDTILFLSFIWKHVDHVPSVILFANFAALVMLGLAATLASNSKTPPQDTPQPRRLDEEELSGSATIQRIEELMNDDHVYRDANLNLERLARKALIPSRQISQAINRSVGMNVSQYVNGYRIAEACDLLQATRRSVTDIMFDVGFQTKSNFNREFRRVTGMTPQAWRMKYTPAAEDPTAGPNTGCAAAQGGTT